MIYLGQGIGARCCYNPPRNTLQPIKVRQYKLKRDSITPLPCSIILSHYSSCLRHYAAVKMMMRLFLATAFVLVPASSIAVPTNNSDSLPIIDLGYELYRATDFNVRKHTPRPLRVVYSLNL